MPQATGFRGTSGSRRFHSPAASRCLAGSGFRNALHINGKGSAPLLMPVAHQPAMMVGLGACHTPPVSEPRNAMQWAAPYTPSVELKPP